MIEPSDSIRAGRYLVDIPYYTTILERINDTTSFNNLIGVYKNIQKHDPEVTLVGYKPTQCHYPTIKEDETQNYHQGTRRPL